LAGRYTVITREGPKVSKDSYDDLEAALLALQERGAELQRTTDAKPVSTMLGRDYEPVQQVAARLELRGPRVRAGVDVRGDGSAEAFTGKVRRRLVAQRGDESPYDALRRELATR
jgi:hypothetical protein